MKYVVLDEAALRPILIKRLLSNRMARTVRAAEEGADLVLEGMSVGTEVEIDGTVYTMKGGEPRPRKIVGPALIARP